MTEGEFEEGKPVAAILLGVLGAILLGAGLWGYFGEQDDKIAGGIVLVGLLLVVLAAFFPRIDGTVELGSLKVPISKARRAEVQLQQGQVTDASRAESAWKAIEETLSKYNVSQVGTPTITQEPPPERAEPTRRPRPEPGELETRSADPIELPREADQSPSAADAAATTGFGGGISPRGRRRSVQLVDDAVFTAGTLTPKEQHLVQLEIARMSSPELRLDSDPKAIRRGDGGRSYRVRRVGNSNLRLWYRPLNEEDPASPLVVMVIEKKGEA